MIPPRPRHGEIVLFLSAAVLAIACSLVPFDLGGGVAPDVLASLVAAWVFLGVALPPLPVLAVIGLVADVFSSRPIGLGALGLVVAAGLLERMRATSSGTPFLLKWIAFAVLWAGILAAQFLILALFLIDGPRPIDLARYWLSTVLFFHIVLGTLHVVRHGWRGVAGRWKGGHREAAR